MPDLMIELAVGDVLVVGDQTLTVIDVDGDEVSFRVDPAPPETDMDPDADPENASAGIALTDKTEAPAAAGLLEVSIGSVRIANDPPPPRRAK